MSLTDVLDVFCWCLPGFPRGGDYQDREPLLPQYNDDTVLQRELHQKLHTYQMLRALTQGFMPSNEQAIINLRTLLASDVLNPENDDLSDSGRALVHYTKAWLKQFIELLQHKNSDDQIQDFIWYLSKSRVSIDMEDIANRTAKAQKKAKTAAAYQSLQTIGSLLLTNSDFRIFLSDLNTIGREIFSDTAFKVSEVAEVAGKRLEPSNEEQQALKEPGADAHNNKPAPTGEDLSGEVSEVAQVVAEGAADVAQEAGQSFIDKVTGDEKATLFNRLKQAVTKLRQRRDYSDSVSTLSMLLQRYALIYSHVVEDTIQTADDDVNANPETERAVKNFWTFIKSFGDAKEWKELERRFNEVVEHGKSDPQFDDLVRQAGNAVQEMLTDPSFFDHAEERFQSLRNQSGKLASDSSLREDIDGLLAKLQSTIKSVFEDQDIAKLIKSSTYIAKILSPAHQYTNTDLVTDAIQVFVPMIIQAVQYVPIPRLEVSTPDVDLLLENLILEPGVTVNNSSFLPFRLRVETQNNVEIRKARQRMTSNLESFVTIKIDGMSIRAEEIGFWLRTHSGLLSLADEGIASFELDERGIDIEMDVEIGKERLEKILTLKAVRVKIHKLDYTLRKSQFALVAWMFKPMALPVIKKAIEVQMQTAVAELIHTANRELLYARERLRATRIADPNDMWTFIKAVSARLMPEEDPDLYTRIGVAQPGQGVFKNVYAPGSIVKVWNEEAMMAKQKIREGEKDGWRNKIFDVITGVGYYATN